ncbi:NAD-dependent epimerase/dehydratase family protein [Paucibacter sp. AS339]|uniref:NAD-dependent epimerase/dehydratase family protein n=1 Tax=Paucibacter hankyongi TaxID=3133434 RepID=UPI003095C079
MALNILVLGGTLFVGRHIVEALLAAGHRVSILTRGQTPDSLPASVERLRGDRDAGVSGLQSLVGRSWDACIDVSGYTPRQVRASAELLRGRIQRYVYISAVSVYGDPILHPVTESCPRLPAASDDVQEIDAQTYGPLKVACEDIVSQLYGEQGCALLRPQPLVGPHDDSGRYAYWIQRAELSQSPAASAMLAPGDGSDHVQFMDVRDLARFCCRVIEQGLSGAFNMAGPRLRWDAFLDLIGAQQRVWVPAALLREAGLSFVELPLYRPNGGPRSSLMDVSCERAQSLGLHLSSPAETLHDVRASLLGQEFRPALTAEREAALIRQALDQA